MGPDPMGPDAGPDPGQIRGQIRGQIPCGQFQGRPRVPAFARRLGGGAAWAKELASLPVRNLSAIGSTDDIGFFAESTQSRRIPDPW
jgi:hypothetical protein